LGIVRCGKINAVNSVAESWTGIGVVAGFAAVMLITQEPLVKDMDAHLGIKLLHILQEVRSIVKLATSYIPFTLNSEDEQPRVSTVCSIWYGGEIMSSHTGA